MSTTAPSTIAQDSCIALQGELNYLAPGEAYASRIGSLVVVYHLAWTAIITIHHCRIGLPSTYPSTTGVAVWSIKIFFWMKNQVVRMPLFLPIFTFESCSTVCRVIFVSHHRTRRKLHASMTKTKTLHRVSRRAATVLIGHAKAQVVTYIPLHLIKGSSCKFIGYGYLE